MKNIYVVVSQTGSIISKIIRLVTGDRYTHVSISLEDDLSVMYSFGRKYTNIPFPGGFVREQRSCGALKKFRRAEIVVLSLSVADEQYEAINEYIVQMYARRKELHYNYTGLFLAKRGIHFHKENAYYCSEFVKELLEKFSLIEEGEFGEVARPVELLNLRKGTVIYRGRLCEFAGN